MKEPAPPGTPIRCEPHPDGNVGTLSSPSRVRLHAESWRGTGGGVGRGHRSGLIGPGTLAEVSRTVCTASAPYNGRVSPPRCSSHFHERGIQPKSKQEKTLHLTVYKYVRRYLGSQANLHRCRVYAVTDPRLVLQPPLVNGKQLWFLAMSA